MAPLELENIKSPLDQTAEEEMAKYGIKRQPVDYFHLGKYRYTNLEDAIAEAKRNPGAA